MSTPVCDLNTPMPITFNGIIIKNLSFEDFVTPVRTRDMLVISVVCRQQVRDVTRRLESTSA